MNRLTYRSGDVTKTNDKCVIAHICNDVGLWGRGFVNEITKTFGEEPRNKYREWYMKRIGFLKLGDVQFVEVNENVTIANMIGQKGVRQIGGQKPIRYDAVKEALCTVMKEHTDIRMPLIGTGLAGGSWDIMEPILIELLEVFENCTITVYTLPENL